MTSVCKNLQINNDYFNQEIKDLEYRIFMKQKLEKEIEAVLEKKFSREFRISISADADVLTDGDVNPQEKNEILKTISAYLLEFDSKNI